MRNSVLRQNQRQIVGIDFLRFFASALVVFFHLQFWRNGEGPVESLSGWSFIAWSGWVGVEIFFVISGFVIAFSVTGSSAQSFFVSRFSRLFPGILLCGAITSIFLARTEPFGLVLHKIFKTLILWPYGPSVDVVYWTLSIEVVFYAVAFATLVFSKGKNFQFIIRSLGLLSTLFWVFRLAFSGGMFPEISSVLERLEMSKAFQVTLIYHGLYFALGASIFKRDWLYAAVFLVAGCVEIYFRAMQFSQFSWLTPLFIWVFSVVFIVVSVNMNSLVHQFAGRWTGVARNLGLITYPLYLIHNEVGVAVQHMMAEIGVSNNVSFIISVCFVVVLAVVIGLMFETRLQIVFKSALNGVFGMRKAIS
jgi:peptidoglycan/LPS O-acetylase OafA/YrhL